MDKWIEQIGKAEDELSLCEEEINIAAEVMAKVAYYNITGDGEAPSEFERRLADREYRKLLEYLDGD